MIKIKSKNITSFCVGFVIFRSSLVLGFYPVPSLPGGLSFPSFSSSGLVNAAALTQDWRQESKLVYSPPIHEESAHAYSSLYAFSNGVIGFNLGYLGSYQSDVAFHSGFLGASFKIANMSFGYTARKRDFTGDPIRHDISLLWAPTYFSRFSVSAYDLNGESQLAVGLGIGKPQRSTLGVDVFLPFNPKGNSMSDQYSVNLSLGKYFERWGYSVGLNFSRQQDGFQNPDQFNGQLSMTRLLRRKLGGIIQLRTQPQAVIFSLVWLDLPSSSEYISKFKGINRKTIWRD